VSTNARYTSLAPRILQVRRPIAAEVVHEVLTFRGKSHLYVASCSDKPFVDTHPFLRCTLSNLTTVYPVYPLTSSILSLLYAGPSQKIWDTLARGEVGPGSQVSTCEANQTPYTPVGSPGWIPTDAEGSW